MTTRFADHLLTGAHASRPAATAVPAGTLYACSDHDLIYQSDGATWSTWATLGGGGGGLDLSALTIERRIQGLSDYVAGYDSSAADERGFPVGQLVVSRQHLVIADDCFFSNPATDVFDGGVQAFASGTAAAASSGTASADHPGCVLFSMGTTTSGRVAFGNQSGNTILFGGGKVRFGVIAKIGALGNATDRYTMRMGFGDAFATEHVDGVFFRYVDNVNSGEWQGVARSNNVETTLDTNTAADTSWHTYEIEVNAAGSSAEFFIDGTSVGTVGSNIPTSAGRECGLVPLTLIKSAGTSSPTILIDAYWCIVELTTSR